MKILFLSIVMLIAGAPVIMAQTIDTSRNAPVTTEGYNEDVAEAPAATYTQQELDTMIYTFVEEMPQFPGGEAALLKYIEKNLKYPKVAAESAIEGRVFIQFVVNKDGSISNVRALRYLDGGCTQEAIRIVKSMPKWTPGKQKGKTVRVYYNLPIIFKLK